MSGNINRPRLSDDLTRGAVAGALGALAMLGAMALDVALTGHQTNNVRVLDGLVPGQRRRLPVFGTLVHFSAGAMLGAFFAWSHHGLPGPLWARGVLFAMVEHVLIWPAVMLLDRVHPGIKGGELEPYNRPVPFLQETFRHAIFGAALGAALQLLEGRRKNGSGQH